MKRRPTCCLLSPRHCKQLHTAVPRWVLNGQKQGGTACLSWSMCGVKVPIERIGGREGSVIV